MRTLLLILGYLTTDSALTDPCEDHTVLDQSWRSSDCVETQCTGQLEGDDKLVQGWYRFKSSGGWKIPETAVPFRHCSTDGPGWLNGSHPTVGQGAVTRTVCFTNYGNNCRWIHEAKIKNCTSYFVYELGPTGGHSAYCTDPETSTSQGPEEQTTLESAESPSSIPAGSADSDPETSTSQGPEEQTTRESAESPSSIPAGSPDSDPETSTSQGPEEQTTLESAESPSSIPAGSADSDPETSTSQGPEEQTTRESTESPSSIPAGSADSDIEYYPCDLKISSMGDIDAETLKDIVEKVQLFLQEQSSDLEVRLPPGGGQCSVVDPDEE
ncbi:uncharacterized protein [Heptranchias perlo]|uniref:uncharacterized protein isoform X2 n=1 Tax=Heptranchias perlo TaxID=212740 RepID=UPI003559F413